MLGGRKSRFGAKATVRRDVQLEDKDRALPTDLTAIYVRGRDGALVQLSNLVKLHETVAPKELNHFNRQRAAIISANIAPGYTLGEALNFLEGAAAEVIGRDAKTELDGQSREFRESGQQLLMIFLLALAFIYLVLSAQFESFVGPLVIMLTVPLGVIGALAALQATGGTLNVYSKAGLVMLIGLVTKNGILIVEFANQLREQGKDKIEAVAEAAALRLRPILMTSLATVLGALPLAMAVGAGAESRQPSAG
jgi:multidrug efflux pump